MEEDILEFEVNSISNPKNFETKSIIYKKVEGTNLINFNHYKSKDFQRWVHLIIFFGEGRPHFFRGVHFPEFFYLTLLYLNIENSL